MENNQTHETKEIVLNHLKKGELNNAIIELDKHFDSQKFNTNDDTYIAFILVSAQYNRLNISQISQTISNEEYRLIFNNLCKSVLHIANSLSPNNPKQNLERKEIQNTDNNAIVIIIEKDFMSYTIEETTELLKEIQRKLEINGKINLIMADGGSTRLTIQSSELSKVQIEKLKILINEGAFKEFKVSNLIEHTPNNNSFQILNSIRSRSIFLNNELESLLSNTHINNKNIISSSFLSIFAVGVNSFIENREIQRLLLQEKELLLSLANKGFHIKCIISPANKNYIIKNGINNAILRTENLLEFLNSKEKGLDNINFAISDYNMKNVYILDETIMLEGHKRTAMRGYDMTMVNKSKDIIKMNIDLYNSLFENLSAMTLVKWGNSDTNFFNRIEIQREATIRCLNNSLNYLNEVALFN